MSTISPFSALEWTRNRIKALNQEIEYLKQRYAEERRKPDRDKRKLAWIEKDIATNQTFIMRLENIIKDHHAS